MSTLFTISSSRNNKFDGFVVLGGFVCSEFRAK